MGHGRPGKRAAMSFSRGPSASTRGPILPLEIAGTRPKYLERKSGMQSSTEKGEELVLMSFICFYIVQLFFAIICFFFFL